MRVDVGPAWSVRFEYDAQGHLELIRVPDCTLPDGSIQPGPELSIRYDARGRPRRREVPLSHGETIATEFRYRSDNEPVPEIATMDADGARLERRFEFDAAGRTIATTEPTGLKVVRKIDHLGRVLREETWEPGRAKPALTNTDWGPLALPERIRRNLINASGVENPAAELIEEFAFDAEGDIESTRLRSGDGLIDRTVRYRRGPDRRLMSHHSAGLTFESRYDGRGLIAETWMTAGNERSNHRRYAYDAVGRLAVIRDEAGNETRM